MRPLVGILATLCVGTGIGAACAANASAQPVLASARPVTVFDAVSVGDFSAWLRPGASVTIERQCGRGFFTEFSAYRSNGGALGAQRWTDRSLLVSWRGRHGRVTFDGITFKNGTRAPVIVTGWCS